MLYIYIYILYILYIAHTHTHTQSGYMLDSGIHYILGSVGRSGRTMKSIHPSIHPSIHLSILTNGGVWPNQIGSGSGSATVSNFCSM